MNRHMLQGIEMRDLTDFQSVDHGLRRTRSPSYDGIFSYACRLKTHK